MLGCMEFFTFLENFLQNKNVKIILDTPFKTSSGKIL